MFEVAGLRRSAMSLFDMAIETVKEWQGVKKNLAAQAALIETVRKRFINGESFALVNF